MTASQPTGAELLSVLQRNAAAEPYAWLVACLSGPDAEPERAALLGRYAGAARRFGTQPIALTEAELGAAFAGVSATFALADLARAALLLAALPRLAPASHVPLATEIFRRGDTGERVSLLKCLALLPDPERFAELGAEACRSHVLSVLEALACENPFPARYMSELAFNQLVMKLMFVELPLERAPGWRLRVNPELLRMTADFAAERRAAGRVVPSDIARVAQAAAQDAGDKP